MITNPYSNAEELARLLWETEMVADKYMDGGVILIRTKDGWRAFLGTLKNNVHDALEKALDANVPSEERTFALGKIPRNPSLINKLWRLLPDCMCFPNYRPLKFVDETEDE